MPATKTKKRKQHNSKYRALYDQNIFDGQTWFLAHGTDFHCHVTAFRCSMFAYAGKRGLKITTSIVDGGLMLRCTNPRTRKN